MDVDGGLETGVHAGDVSCAQLRGARFRLDDAGTTAKDTTPFRGDLASISCFAVLTDPHEHTSFAMSFAIFFCAERRADLTGTDEADLRSDGASAFTAAH